MNTIDLCQVSLTVLDSGIHSFLLAPSIYTETYHLRKSIIELARLIHPRRPNTVVAYDPESPRLRTATARLAGMPQIRLGTSSSTVIRAVDIGHNDLTEILPEREDEFLLFLKDAPGSRLPSWPAIVADLDAVLVGPADELIQIQTIDAQLIASLQSLPTCAAALDQRNK